VLIDMREDEATTVGTATDSESLDADTQEEEEEEVVDEL
jgi:hypothetical protein